MRTIGLVALVALYLAPSQGAKVLGYALTGCISHTLNNLRVGEPSVLHQANATLLNMSGSQASSCTPGATATRTWFQSRRL